MDGIVFFGGQPLDRGVIGRITGDESTALQDRKNIVQIVSLSKLPNVTQKVMWAEVCKRILDPIFWLVWMKNRLLL